AGRERGLGTGRGSRSDRAVRARIRDRKCRTGRGSDRAGASIRERGVTPMATMSTTELLDVFKNMTVLELNDFLKAFEDEFGVTAAAPVAVATAPAAGGGAAGAGAP